MNRDGGLNMCQVVPTVLGGLLAISTQSMVTGGECREAKEEEQLGYRKERQINPNMTARVPQRERRIHPYIRE